MATEKVYILVNEDKYIAAQHDGDESTIYFDENRLHTNDTNLPYWNDIPLIRDASGDVFVQEESVVVNSGDTISLVGDGSVGNPITLSMYKNLGASITATVLGTTCEPGGVVTGSGREWEFGTTITAVKLNWGFTNGNGIVSQSLSGPSVPTLDDLEIRTVDIDGLSIKSNTNFSITGRDNKGTSASSSAGFSFLNSIYWGLSENPTITMGEISDGSVALASGRNQERTFTNCGGKYIWFAWPVSMPSNPKFNAGGFDSTGWNEQTFPNFVNRSGLEVPMILFRSEYPQTAESVVVIVS